MGQNAKLPPGFPDRSPDLDVLPGFKNPPPGYGEVTFWWWTGDTLKHRAAGRTGQGASQQRDQRGAGELFALRYSGLAYPD